MKQTRRFFLFLVVGLSFFIIPHKTFAAVKCQSVGLQAKNCVAPNEEDEKNQKCRSEGHGCDCPVPTGVSNLTVSNYICESSQEYCPETDETVNLSCCVCEKKDESGTIAYFPIAHSGLTYAQCDQKCKIDIPDSQVSHIGGAGLFYKTGGGTSLGVQQFENAQCFPRTLCEGPDYGGPGAFRPGMGCKDQMGKCVAPEPVIYLSTPIGNVKVVHGFRSYVAAVYQFLIGISLVVVAIAFVYGGFLYIVSSSLPSITNGREIMTDAGIGLVIILSAMTLLRTINPATLKLNALEVFMINKQQILSSQFCGDVNTSKPISFAEVGREPNVTPAKEAKFTTKQEETRCNMEYYAEGFGDYRCMGRKCPTNNSVCVQCNENICLKGSGRRNYICVKASVFGTVPYGDGHFMQEIRLMAICKDAFTLMRKTAPKEEDIKAAKDSIVWIHAKENPPIDGDKSQPSGQQTYRLILNNESVNEAKKGCATHGGIIGGGFVFAVKYKDPNGYLPSDTYNNAPDKVKSIVNDKFTSMPAIDDFAIVDKQSCAGVGNFGGYADGRGLAFFNTDATRGIMCGMLEPVGHGRLIDLKNLWSPEEVQKTIEGEKAVVPIVCNFSLNSATAPSDPSNSGGKVGGCTAGGRDLLNSIFESFADLVPD